MSTPLKLDTYVDVPRHPTRCTNVVMKATVSRLKVSEFSESGDR